MGAHVSLSATELDDLLQRGFRYAFALTHDRDAAKDLVQEAYWRVARQPEGLWTFAYVARVIRNLFIDQQRKRSLWNRWQQHQSFEEAVMPLHSTEPSLEQALQQLPLQSRELLYLFVVEEYTAQEIADLTGKPRGTVLSTVHRAKQKLRSMLSETYQGL